MSMVKYLVLFFLFISTSVALGHSWYPMECCSDGDCKPVPCEEISEVEGGYSYQGVFFSKDKVKMPPDQYCHVCMSPYTKTPYCIYVQPTS